MADDFQQRVAQFEQELRLLSASFGISIHVAIDLPEYKKLPLDAQLALQVLAQHKAVFILSYQDESAKENKDADV